MKIKQWNCLLMILAGLMMLVLIGGVSAADERQPAEKEARETRKAAMLPIRSSNDPLTTNFVTGGLVQCLEGRHAFAFVSNEKVDQAVAAGGYDLTKIFGLSKEEYKALADSLGVDYLLHGIIAVRKSLKFTGWRKDVDVYIKLYDGKTGESIDSWRSISDFSFTDADTEKNAQAMAQPLVSRICEKMQQSGY